MKKEFDFSIKNGRSKNLWDIKDIIQYADANSVKIAFLCDVNNKSTIDSLEDGPIISAEYKNYELFFVKINEKIETIILKNNIEISTGEDNSLDLADENSIWYYICDLPEIIKTFYDCFEISA